MNEAEAKKKLAGWLWLTYYHPKASELDKKHWETVSPVTTNKCYEEAEQLFNLLKQAGYRLIPNLTIASVDWVETYAADNHISLHNPVLDRMAQLAHTKTQLGLDNKAVGR